jgi:hypothetical protein
MSTTPKLITKAIEHGYKAGCRVTERKIMAEVDVKINGSTKPIRLSVAKEYVSSEDSKTGWRRPDTDIIEKWKTDMELKVKNFDEKFDGPIHEDTEEICITLVILYDPSRKLATGDHANTTPSHGTHVSDSDPRPHSTVWYIGPKEKWLATKHLPGSESGSG